MKTLPDNPNLDHLRRQAKDLLTGLRDVQPGATLAQAQACLAAQYGFRDWTALRAEIARRRSSADLADPALARAIAASYGLGEVTGQMRSLARADEIGRPWSLVTDRGRFALRTLENWRPIVDPESDVALQHAAARAGVLLPAPLRSRAGNIIESIGGHRWRVNEWLHSGPPLAAPVSATITHRVGEILATIHRLRLPVDRISPWHASRLCELAWADLAATAEARGLGFAPALRAAVANLTDLETVGDGAPVAQPVLCHNALGPGSTRLGRDGGLVVTDWEHAGGQPPDWELGDALLHWTVGPNQQINTAGARALLAGYRSVAGAVPPLGLAMFRGAVTSLANYTTGQVQQAIRAAGGPDADHWHRSVRHLLSQLPSRTTLERLLQEVTVVADC